MKKLGFLELVVLGVCLVSGGAYAGQIGSLSVSSFSTAPIVTITGPGVVAEPVYASPFLVTGGSWLPDPAGSAPAGFDRSSFYSFCTDIGVSMVPSSRYEAVSFAGQSGVSPHWRQVGGSYMPAIQMAQYLYLHNYGTAFSASGVNLTQAAGLQLAIWNVLYDSDFSIAGGAFHAAGNAAALADAQAFLAALASVDSSAWSSLDSTWLRPEIGGTQGMLYPPCGSKSDVPDGASTLLLLGMAMAGGGVLTRRLRK